MAALKYETTKIKKLPEASPWKHNDRGQVYRVRHFQKTNNCDRQQTRPTEERTFLNLSIDVFRKLHIILLYGNIASYFHFF